MALLPDESVDLAVTSPPYPMIQMWDSVFMDMNQDVGEMLSHNRGIAAFEAMHQELDKVWRELFRVLKKGAIACINIGDATRTIDAHFALYANHTRIQTSFQKLGFTTLPAILWRKQTNAPNKFMGSGMMPPGAYVTLEHEYILIFRKGNKRLFNTDRDRKQRMQSAFFWEERNTWFSDVWMDLKGTSQKLDDSEARKRSAAFPFELAYRLIHMFSVKNDMVLDPFLGTGTTMFAAMAAGRNSIGYEINRHLNSMITSRKSRILDISNQRIEKRLNDHLEFVKNRVHQKGKLKYTNRHYLFPVMTRQETELLINEPASVSTDGRNTFNIGYRDDPQAAFIQNRIGDSMSGSQEFGMQQNYDRRGNEKRLKQMNLF